MSMSEPRTPKRPSSPCWASGERLPDLSGEEVARSLRSVSDVPIIIRTCAMRTLGAAR